MMKSIGARTLAMLSLVATAAVAQPARAQTAADSHLVQLDVTWLSGVASVQFWR